MATILLQAAGAALGGLLGPVGATIGTAAGALAGYVADRALLESTKHYYGPRLSGPRPLTAEEGTPIPRVYGTARLGAAVIWATRFEETRQTERQGFKGGPKVTTYAYFANAAFALCEGEIAGIRRIWADGREMDREQVEIRVYTGTADQPVDPLIEARQGAGNAPAYRGIAYVVFERLPLDQYGNRIPQFQFEVIRPVGDLNTRVRAVALVPGSTEFGLSPEPVTRLAASHWDLPTGASISGGREILNRNILFARSDLAASLDELQMLCPNVENVALVCTWFGDDLRAGNCTVRPKVVDATAPDASPPWLVSGLSAANAIAVSRHDGAPAYGGTPSDGSVIDAIAEIRNRGLKVTLYPFVMMDIPADNALPDPYGSSVQPAYPWRGRITCDPAPGLAASADKTPAARQQVSAFCGTAEPGDFSSTGATISFGGGVGDWGYRRLVLHYAKLAAKAGGVDGFLIGSELRGLTTLRDENGAFPFVEELVRLADEVKSILGDAATVTYGADWTEYFGHHPDDGSGDMIYHLDPLWASPAIGAVGIDNYMPLADWRDEDYAGPNPDGAGGPHDGIAMRAAIAGGEGYDWYYASDGDRAGRIRTPITDGAYDKPWVFRFKDLKNWWANPHHDRLAGVENAEPTAWVPAGKPIAFSELGCAAIDKGANQPNAFVDPKSSESRRPYFSSGGRDDAVQHAFLAAHLGHWDPDSPEFDESANPASPVYGGRMVDASRIFLWCWDARPFPAFPLQVDRWGDGDNWLRGHWLNGRLDGAALADLIDAILADHRLPAADTSRVAGSLAGYVSENPGSARVSIEPLLDLFGLVACDAAGKLSIFNELSPPGQPFTPAEFVAADDGPDFAETRAPDHELPGEIVLHFRDLFQDFQAVSVRRQKSAVGASAGQRTIAFPGVMEPGLGEALAAQWLRRKWAERDRLSFRVPMSSRDPGPGSVIAHPFFGGTATFLVTAIEEGIERHVHARRILQLPPIPDRAVLPAAAARQVDPGGPPLAIFLDLPLTGDNPPEAQLRLAAWRRPWRSLIASVSPEDTGFVERATVSNGAIVGILGAPLAAGPTGRIDYANSVELRLLEGELAGATPTQMLNGANALAVRAGSGAWELLQFQNAEETAPANWRLTGLLRGQLGTDDAMAAGAEAGAFAVLLDDAVVPVGLRGSEIGLQLNWRVVPAGLLIGTDNRAENTETGGLRALLPLSPVHLRGARNASGGFDFSWIRRGRVDADSWLAPDIPLGEASEAYRVRVLRIDGGTVRETDVAQARWTCDAADLGDDLQGGQAFDLVVCQLSAAVGEGIPAVARFHLD